MQKKSRQTAAEWRQILSDYKESGLSLMAYGRLHHLAYSSLLYWRRKLKHESEDAPRSFVALHQGTLKELKTGKIKIYYDYQLELEIPADYPTTELVHLIKGLSC